MKLNKFTTFLLLLALLATVILAQDKKATTTANAELTTTAAQETSASDTPNETSTSEAPKETSTSEAKQTSTSEAKQTSTSLRTTETTPTGKPPALTTSTSTTESLPAVTDTSGSTLPPKPKLSTAREYPKPTVPPTSGAPFMQKSSLPEGTFFIAVGAALGFLMFSVFAWRMIVAWSLHRSVKHAAEQANAVDSKAIVRPPQGGNSGGFYAAGAGSSVSLGDLSKGVAGAKQTPNSSLFFSPTAGVSAAGDRRSTYLPAGYYPTGNGSGSLGPNASQTHFHTQSISSRYGSYDRRGLGPSPPGSPLISPSMPPSRGGSPMLPTLRGSESRTSLSILPVPGQRAPSAYLEDLFENHQQQPGGRY
ncbi:hypothetical protein L211DRAFT_59053 [Terfezia boudieri ATCC MYA-4762]|uniref:Uncharacterized protein n=1 Tax=Terfezia boudieri ATCC MYA-4762 TaxID=1051890 RepID=A0A3N4LXE3_9PEZI|nr:hypothetical protein L211DRAFT_59053 [Terfezia boudieri ATCC MYA-4762]